jgi:hypothetical protein
MEERGQDIGAALIADRQAPAAQQPGQRPLHLPTMTAQPGAGLHPTAGDPRGDVPAPQRPPAGRVVVALIAMELGRSPPWPPGRPRGPITAGTASTICSSSESCVLAADSPTASGIPPASTSRWSLEPALPRSTGFAPVSFPTPRPDTGRVDRGPGPVDLAVVSQPVQQPMMQGLPHPGLLPVPQPPPAGHAAATASSQTSQHVVEPPLSGKINGTAVRTTVPAGRAQP